VGGGVVLGRTGTVRNLGGNAEAALLGLILRDALADLIGLGSKASRSAPSALTSVRISAARVRSSAIVISLVFFFMVTLPKVSV
jgi:hypothetical protein